MKWKSSKQEKRERQERESRVREEARLAEERRRSCLSMYERIEESDASPSVKEILHMLAGENEHD